jgi:hypothetical protein
MPNYQLAYTAKHEDITIVEFSSREKMKEWLLKYPTIFDSDFNNIRIFVAPQEISVGDVLNDIIEDKMDIYTMVEKLEDIKRSIENDSITEDTLQELLSLVNPVAEKLELKYNPNPNLTDNPSRF